MDLNELKDKALTLPMSPGVYIMRDESNKVIYVGKAKKLKNRVSQYFQDTASHNAKTRIMVSKVDHFDVIVASSEFEALVLECSLIKQYQPKYNILLKDDKGYPYLRLDMHEPYPMIKLVNRPSDDGAGYYGPFGSRGVTNGALEAITAALKLPTCSKKFPRDIGKDRPCLNYHMNTCAGWCTGKKTAEEYRAVMEQVRQLLRGNYKAVAQQLRKEMMAAADALNFELAASLRDRLNAVENLGKKQLVTSGSAVDVDVVGYAQTQTKACFTVLHFRDGNLVDKDYEILAAADNADAALTTLVKQYYFNRGFAPKTILLSREIEDQDLFEQLLFRQYAMRTQLKVPARGDKLHLVDMAVKNAAEEVQRITDKEDRVAGSLELLGKMLVIPPPKRIESFDISNIAGTDIVASMVVFEDGKPKRSAYKRFKINDLEGQDDYASMAQVVRRRFSHYLHGDKGFDQKPDLILIDGGAVHAGVAREALEELELSFCIYGMVKDDRHRTRALVTPEGEQIAIETQQAVFSLIGNIQEETHRFAINFHRQLRSKRLRYSQLDSIAGIGPKRKEQLLKTFKSLAGIAAAELGELERHLPKDAALAVYNHFRKEG